MRLTKWIALLLSICLLSAMVLTALSEEEEEEILFEEIESVSEETETAEEEITTTLAALEGAEAGAAEGEETSGDPAEGAETESGDDDDVDPADAPGGETSVVDDRYAKVTRDMAPVFARNDDEDGIGKLAAGEVVLRIGEKGGLAEVAFNANGKIVEAWMKPEHLEGLGEEAAEAYVRRIASGRVSLYAGNINIPLGPVGSGSDVKAFLVVGNYTNEGNQKVYTANGKKIYADLVPATAPHQCWTWARNMYKIVWGTKFNSSFVGDASTGYNLLRKLNDDERRLTPENLKYFVRNSKAGATLRITDCLSTCTKFDSQDGYCSNNSAHTHIHSLIIAEIRENGMVTMDCANGVVYTRFYTWEDFCKKWAKWDHIKYIKWPNAPALLPTEKIDGHEVSICSETYRARASAATAATVRSLPTGGEKVATLVYPATFSASRMSMNTIDGHTWVYGKTAAGVAGWLALTDAVANVNDTIKVTGVSLEPNSLVLLKGGTATLKAIIAPVDASNQKVNWSSSNTAVATVKDGVVTGVAGGTARIIATSADGGRQAACEVSVAQADVSKTLSKTGSNGTVKLVPGQQMQLVPKFATVKGWKVKSVSSSKSACASVDKKTGIVTARKAGSATLTVKTKNGKQATLKVKVIDPNTPTAIALNKSGTVTMKAGDTLKLYTKISPETASSTLTWKSSNPKVATVDSEGNVIALGQDKKKKTCYIGVMTANGKYDTVKIKVK